MYDAGYSEVHYRRYGYCRKDYIGRLEQSNCGQGLFAYAQIAVGAELVTTEQIALYHVVTQSYGGENYQYDQQ